MEVFEGRVNTKRLIFTVSRDRIHQIHTGHARHYLAHSVQSIAESSRRPGLRSANTADYIKCRKRTKFGERCFSHAGPDTWNSLPDLPLTLIDLTRGQSNLTTRSPATAGKANRPLLFLEHRIPMPELFTELRFFNCQ